jgi:L-ascorbate metabolism protein UlaG (beta-lactamase superfamily)
MYQVIATGSTGNAIIYHNSILVDCGVPFSKLKPHLHSIQIILLTHAHGDHINKSTLQKLVSERPTLRIGCCEWMKEHVSGIKNVDLFEIGKIYNYGSFQLSPIKLYHDVPNCGYRIFKDGKKIIHCTDTAHLEGISAAGYDLYAIEHNYNADTVYTSIAEKQARGEYAHQVGSINSHLSEQQARDFIFKNKADHSQVLRLHETKS